MISPFTIYLILMLDDIKHLFEGLALFTCMATGAIMFIVLITEGATWPWAKKWLKWSTPAVVLCFIISVLIPTTKIAAAMYVIPAIANNETIQREAGELYQLAKQGLKELVTPPTLQQAPK